MSIDRPKYDPADLSKYDLTEEEAEDIRQGMLEIDRGETISLDQLSAEISAELQAELRLQEMSVDQTCSKGSLRGEW